MEKPLHVGLVSLHTNPIAQPGQGDAGGMNVYIHQLAQQLAAQGTQIEIFTRATDPDGPATKLMPDGETDISSTSLATDNRQTSLPKTVAPVTVAPNIRLWKIPAGPNDLLKGDLVGIIPEFVANAHAVIAHQLEQPLDLLHSHYWLSGIAGLELAAQSQVPLVHSMHTTAQVKNAHLAPGDTPEPEHRLLGETQIIQNADLLMASAHHEKQALIERYKADPNKIQVVYPGVNTAIFHPNHTPSVEERSAESNRRHVSKLRLNLGISPDTKLVVFAGRVQKLKAPDILIKALPLLPDEVQLAIVGGPSGDPAIIPQLENLATELGVADRVQFVGPVAPETLANWYRAADVVAVPSYNETFGLVAAEALACGTPVVAANVGGLREIVQDGETGTLVPSYEPQDWAKALNDIIEHPHHRAWLAQNAAAQSGLFTWAQTAAQTLDGYQKAIQGAGRRS